MEPTKLKSGTVCGSLLAALLLGIPVSIYPNPASNILNIDFNKMPEPNSFLDIEDNLGRKVLKVKLNSDYKQSINIGSLATGVYYIKYTEINKVVVKKLYIIKE